MMTWGQIKAAMLSLGVADTDPVDIAINMPGGTAPITIPGYTVFETVVHKAVEEVRPGPEIA